MKHMDRKYYSVGFKEQVVLWIKSIICVLVLDYYFFRSLPALIPLGVVGFFYHRLLLDELKQKKQTQIRLQFRELLMLLSTGLRAGSSPENALEESFPEMKKLFGADSVICKMLLRIKEARNNRKSISKVIYDFGEKLEIEDMREFARIFDIAYQKSGNLGYVMEQTANSIMEKLEVANEVSLMINDKTFEMKIMTFMPFIIVSYVELTTPGYFYGMYHTSLGKLVMSALLILYAGAYLAAVKIMKIEVT